jgi:hypothetical protein
MRQCETLLGLTSGTVIELSAITLGARLARACFRAD